MTFYEQIESNFRISLKDNIQHLFCKASEEQLSVLKNLIGEDVTKVIDFYRELQPCEMGINDSCTCLIDIEGVVEENTELAPGAYLSKIGIFVIAVTIGGNAVCIDTKDMTDGDPAVLVINHSFLYCDDEDLCAEDTDLSDIEIANVPSFINEDDFDEEDYIFNYENVRKFVYKLEDKFTVFIEKMSNNDYGDLEEYL